MKYTAWALLLVGVMVGIYGVIASMPPEPNLVPPAQAPSAPAPFPFSFGNVLVGFSVLAIGAGVALLVLGGRGVIRTKNLAVRN